MGILSEPFTEHPVEWLIIIMIIGPSSLLGYLILGMIYPSIIPESDNHKIFNSLNCDELKEWLKYNMDYSTAKTMYIDKCIGIGV